MIGKKNLSCLGVGAIVSLTAPSALGTVIKLIQNSGKIVKAANQVKKSVEDVKKMSTELSEQLSQKNYDNVESVKDGGEVDMG